MARMSLLYIDLQPFGYQTSIRPTQAHHAKLTKPPIPWYDLVNSSSLIHIVQIEILLVLH